MPLTRTATALLPLLVAALGGCFGGDAGRDDDTSGTPSQTIPPVDEDDNGVSSSTSRPREAPPWRSRSPRWTRAAARSTGSAAT